MRSEWRLSLAALVMLVAGCTPYVMSNSAVDQYPKSEDEIDFLAAVEKMPAVTNNDALHAMLILQDGDDRSADYEARRAEGVRRQWVHAGALANPNEAARVGWLASAGCRVMAVKGGLTMRLVGPIPRYATRELVYMEILPMRTENQVLTGAEFVDFMNRLGRLSGRNRRDKPEPPLGLPAGESAASPGNEGAIQEGPLPKQGPREEPPAPSPEPPPPTTPPTTPPQPAPAAEPAPAPAPAPAPDPGPAPAPAPAPTEPSNPAGTEPSSPEPGAPPVSPES